MPRSPEGQRRVRAEMYADYKRLRELYGEPVVKTATGIWTPHYRQLRAREQLESTMAERPPKMTAEQRALVGAEWCVTCKQDCLPLDAAGGVCGFCDRIPATGESAAANAANVAEERRRRWRESKRRSRENKREVAA